MRRWDVTHVRLSFVFLFALETKLPVCSLVDIINSPNSLLLTTLERTSKYLCTCMWLGKAWYGFSQGATASSDPVASYRWGFIVVWWLICSLQIFFYLTYQHYLKHLRLAPLPFLLGALFILWLIVFCTPDKISLLKKIFLETDFYSACEYWPSPARP